MRKTVYDYCYDGTDVFVNKLGIHNKFVLDDTVDRLVSVNFQSLLDDESCIDCFGPEYLKHIHRILFQDCYDWAGEYRECPMGRNINFCPPERIPSEMAFWSRSFQSGFMSVSGSSGDMADRLAGFWGSLNQIHPFRDGNGRSQAAFFIKACEAKGLAVSFPSKDIKNLRTARDEASDGRPRLLVNLLSRSLSGEAKPYNPVKQRMTAWERLRFMLERGYGGRRADHQDAPEL